MDILHDWETTSIVEFKEIAHNFTESVQTILRNKIKYVLDNVFTAPQNVLKILFNRIYMVNKVIEEKDIPVELLGEAIRNAVEVINRVCNEECSYTGLVIDLFKDIEVKDWEGITFRFKLKGNYETLLKVWDELSITVSKILGRYSRYVYVVVEPHE